MSPEEYRQLNQLFLAAMDLPQEERAAFLSQACAGDARLRRRIEAMLEADADSDQLIDQLAHPSAVESDTDEITELPSGARLGHYRLARQIGRGGMGAVYLAHDDKLDRQVALKVLPARFTSDTERVRRFQREARAASALNHPNILTIFDIGQERGSHYIATEFVEGRTLRAVIGSAELSFGEALDAVMQISSALSAAHQAGIIHRDIKPENVMARPDGYVKVLDFGLAKLTERVSSPREGETDATQSSVFETQEGAVLGTVSYMSPEQARGLKVDTRTDLFSLGVVLYELITGERPFNGSTRNHILVAILDQDPLPLSHYISNAPPELQRIISRALSKDRDDRYQLATELHADLKQLKNELAVGVRLERRLASGELRTEVEVAPKLALTTAAEIGHKTTGALSLLSELKPRKRNVALLLAGVIVLFVAVAAGLARWFWAGGQKESFVR
jgi:eukaryotic-like serine/threonine-protein kinase